MSKNRRVRSVRIGLIQMRSEAGPEANLKKVLAQISEAARKGAQIIGLGELFLTPYFPQTEDARNFKLAEPVPGPTARLLQKAASKHRVTLVASVFEKRGEGIYHNTSVLIGPDGTLLGKYRKMHLPNDSGYYEKFYFTPGDLGFRSFPTPYGKVGMLICWDQWFPEAARLTALGGAEIIFYPTAIGWLDGEAVRTRRAEHAAWELVQRSHAVANGVFVACVNRIGHEGKIRFWGSSFIAGPLGQVLARASRDREEILLSDCDLAEIGKARKEWPFMRERRIDAYGALTARFLDDTPSSKNR